MFLGISKWFYLFSFLASLIFILFPQIDIFISTLFYSPSEGFFWANNVFILFLYAIPKPIVILSVLALIILIIDLSFRKQLLNIRPLLLLYFISVMVVGPGLIVNTLFKDNWGRARPVNVMEFHGPMMFTPAWTITNQCNTNCSFVCGHAGGTYSLIALALLVKRRRKMAIALAIGIGSLVGLGRIIQGGHFFSDVVLSFIFVYLTAKIIYYFVFDKKLFSFIDARYSSDETYKTATI